MNEWSLLQADLRATLCRLHQEHPDSSLRALVDAAMTDPAVARRAAALGLPETLTRSPDAWFDTAESVAFDAADGLGTLAVPLAYQWCCLRWMRTACDDDGDAMHQYLERIIQQTPDTLVRTALTSFWLVAMTRSVESAVLH